MNQYIFLSYAVEDRAYTEELAYRLRNEAGIDVWWFEGRQEPGVPYMQELIRRIEHCLAVVVVLSPASAFSNGVIDEIGYARTINKRIIPVVIGHDKTSDSLTSHVRSGPVTYTLRKLDMIDGNRKDEIIPRLRRFLEGPTTSQPGTGGSSEKPGYHDNLIGRTINGYFFVTPIAQTNYSIVYTAQEQAIGRTVAVKMITLSTHDRPTPADLQTYNQRFSSEARRISRLEHPNIVPLYNYWHQEQDARAFL